MKTASTDRLGKRHLGLLYIHYSLTKLGLLVDLAPEKEGGLYPIPEMRGGYLIPRTDVGQGHERDLTLGIEVVEVVEVTSPGRDRGRGNPGIIVPLPEGEVVIREIDEAILRRGDEPTHTLNIIMYCLNTHYILLRNAVNSCSFSHCHNN